MVGGISDGIERGGGRDACERGVGRTRLDRALLHLPIEISGDRVPTLRQRIGVDVDQRDGMPAGREHMRDTVAHLPRAYHGGAIQSCLRPALHIDATPKS